MASKRNDKRIDDFREKGMDFITSHFKDMEDAMAAFKKEGNWDKAVALYMKLADKVIPSLSTQAVDTGNDAIKPEWMQKIDKVKKTVENSVK